MFAIAARRGSKEPHLIDVAPPGQPAPDAVICRTLQLGICGTDREILESADPFTPPGEEHLILGHECLARVERVGANVSDLRAGDLVVPVVRRRKTAARTRVDMLAFGHFTERGIVQEHGFSATLWCDRPEHLLPVAASLSEVAVFTEPLAVAEKAVNEALAVQRGRLGPEAWTASPPRVLVTGMGPIGFAAVLSCICRQWPVTMYGRDPTDSFRAQLAQQLGARYVVDRQFVAVPQDVEADGFDLVLECTGSDEVMVQTAQSLASCGVMVWLGSRRVPVPELRPVSRLMRHAVVRNHVHLGSVNSAPRDFVDAVRHLEQLQRSHPRQLAAIITTRVSAPQALWHFLHRKRQGIKTVLTYT